MDERWRILLRVRDLRTRLALNELIRQRRAYARAQDALERWRRRQAELEELALQASSGLTAPESEVALGSEVGAITFSAAQAHALLDFATDARTKAREAAVQIRRARLLCDRAQAAVDQATTAYRREAGRKDAVHSHWQAELRAARLRQVDREDAAATEDHNACALVQRLSGPIRIVAMSTVREHERPAE